MADKKVVEFVKKLQTNSDLKTEFEANPEVVVQRETGLSLADVRAALQGVAGSELSESELASVAGGYSIVDFPYTDSGRSNMGSN